MTISVTALHGPTFPFDPEGPVIACAVDLRAVARGPQGAVWESATFRWYLGPDRATPVDSSIAPASEVRDSWGGDIAAGATQETRWTITAGIPFSAAIEFRYRPQGGSSQRATVTFTCGPTIGAGTPPPQITALAVEPPAKDPEPGDTLLVDYSVTSQAGLWLTAATLSGPCEIEQIFFDSLKTTLRRAVRIPIPRECGLNTPITVTIFALDAAAQEVSRRLETQISLVDRSPPTITPLFFPPGGGSATTSLTGNYFVGDSIHLLLHASDNYALRSFIWEILPTAVRDSVSLSGTGMSRNVFIKIPPEAVGTIQLRLYARDSAGHTSNVVLTATDAIRVYATVARPTDSATVSGEIREIAVDVPRGLIYLLQSNERRLTAVFSATLDIARTIDLPWIPTDLDLSAGGDSLVLVVPSQQALAILDLRSSSPQPSLIPLVGIDTANGQRPWNVRVAANGKAFVAFRGLALGAHTLLEVDLATGQQRVRGQHDGAELVRSPDASVILLAGGPVFLQRYESATDTFGPRRPPVRSGFASLNAGGTRLSVSLDVYDASLDFLRSVESPFGGPVAAQSAITVDGEDLYMVHWPLGVVRSRVSDGRMMDRTPNPIRPTYIRASPDGTMLITVDSQSGATSRLSTIRLQ